MRNRLDLDRWVCDIQLDIEMGKGSSGSTNTTTSSSTPPPDVTAAYDKALGMAGSAAAAPLQQYQGNTVAGFTPTQNSAFGSINNLQGVAAPFISQAQQLIQNGTQPLWSGTQQFSPSAIGQYQSPYTQQVYNAQVAQENNTDAQQQAALQGNAISKGAWGGDRAGVASAVLAGQQDLANNSTNANILNTGYQNAVGEFNTQQQAQLGANEANSYLNQQGAFGLGNLGNEALSTGLTGANAQLQAGTLQQQQNQAQLNVPYQQFLQQQAYPFQTAQFYSNVAEGLGSNSGGTGTSTSTAPAPNSILPFGLKRGGFVQPKRYASGGGASYNVPDLSVDFIPSTSPGNGRGPPSAPTPQAQSQGSSPLAQLSALTNIVKSFSGGSGSGSSGNVPGFDSLMSGFGGGGGSAASSYLSSSPTSQVASDVAAQDAASASSSGIGDFFSSLFSAANRGGRITPPHMRSRYAIGGEVLPDVVSGVGDIIGAFFGMPTAGDMGVKALSTLDGGRTGGEGVMARTMGSIGGQGDSGGGTGWKRGGLAHFDDGGSIGGQTPMAAEVQGQQMPTAATGLNGMTPEQLQQYVMRLPIGSPQQQRATAVLQQKRMMPNVGAAPQGGFGSQQPSTMLARGGFADGGDTSGIYIDAPPPPDQIARTQDLRDELGQNNTDVPQVSASALAPPGGFGAATPARQMVASAQPPAQPPAQASTPSASDSSATTDLNTRSHSEPNPWLSLAKGAFALAAGRSPYVLENLGNAGLTGLTDYSNQQKEADTTNEAVDKLMAEAKQHRDTLAQQQKAENDTNNYHMSDLNLRGEANKNTAAYQKGELANNAARTGIARAQLDQGKFIPVADATGNKSIYNTATGQWVSPPQTTGSNAIIKGEGDAPLTGQAYLDKLHETNPTMAAQVKAMDEGDLTFPSGFAAKAPYWQQRLDALYNYNPQASQQTAAAYKQFMSGPVGNTVRSINVATNHIDLADKLVDALSNNDTKAINQLGNYAKTQLGLSTAPTNLDAVKTLLSGELEKAAAGNIGAVTDRQALAKELDNANSPELLHGVTQQFKALMGGQYGGLQQQYEAQTGRKDFSKFLTPASKSAINLAGGTASSAGASQSATPPTFQIPPRESRKANQVYPTPKGNMLWTGTGWVPAAQGGP